jgi:hypothetical protein
MPGGPSCQGVHVHASVHVPPELELPLDDELLPPPVPPQIPPGQADDVWCVSLPPPQPASASTPITQSAPLMRHLLAVDGTRRPDRVARRGC